MSEGICARPKRRDRGASSQTRPGCDDQLLREVGRAFARQTAQPALSQQRRVNTASDVLGALGGEVSVVELEDGWELRGIGCPLTAVVLERPTHARSPEPRSPR